jgi:hypothetical protein
MGVPFGGVIGTAAAPTRTSADQAGVAIAAHTIRGRTLIIVVTPRYRLNGAGLIGRRS